MSHNASLCDVGSLSAAAYIAQMSPRRVLLIGGTGPVGQSAVPHLLEAGHTVAVAHTGRHESMPDLEHLHGDRTALLALDGPAEAWRPEALVDTFPGGATAAKARELGALAERCSAEQVVAVSSIDVYRHCADAGVDGHPPAELPREPLPLDEASALRTDPSPESGPA